MSARKRLVLIHPSDELYGADRILLELHDALTATGRQHAEVLLPTDDTQVALSCCSELYARGATVRHLDRPILRRAYRHPSALLGLARRTVSAYRHLRRARPSMVYLTTRATFFFQAEDGIRDGTVTGVQTCALPI